VAEISSYSGDRPAEQIALDNLSAQEAVDLIVRVLNNDQAEVVMLRVLGDLSFAQVAKVMGRDVSWVGVTNHRALKRLASRFRTRVLVTK
jgi:RNA polymerase sigma-70 factor (ECF subfamily)